MAKQFIPSNRTEDEKTLAQLRYLQKAASALEAQLMQSGVLPSWVKTRITRASMEMSVATSYAIQQQEKKR